MNLTCVKKNKHSPADLTQQIKHIKHHENMFLKVHTQDSHLPSSEFKLPKTNSEFAPKNGGFHQIRNLLFQRSMSSGAQMTCC